MRLASASAAAVVAFDFSDAEAEQLGELYHGLWFNEPRRTESVLAHAAFGGPLAHGSQSRPNMSGGAVVPYGLDVAVIGVSVAIGGGRRVRGRSCLRILR